MPVSIDALDAKIVELLQADGRQPNTAIARRLGVSEVTVRKRIARLIKDRVIQVGAWTEPLKIGYQVYAHIEIKAEPARVEEVADRLARLPEIFFLGICTGAFDIFAAALLRSREDMYEFMTKRLNRVPGIQGTSTSFMIRIVKREYQVPLLVTDERPVKLRRDARPSGRHRRLFRRGS